ncbi:MAG: helix-turn-helix domain-containing protein [Halobacteriaceae archaeon]
MPRAKLTLSLPEGVWIGGLSRSFPEARFRILAAVPGDGTGAGLIEVSASDTHAIVEALRETDEVIDLEVLQQGDGEDALLQFETSEPLLLAPMQDSGVPIETPFDIFDGEVSWEVTAPQDRLSDLGRQLTAFGIDFTVEYIHQHVSSDPLLTDRQRRLVEAAVERGYYDTPRECSLTDLAEDLDIAKSTCSETLHRAEGKIIREFVAEAADAPVTESTP